ncbi:MAG: hypothetical protein JEY99_02715 [Spirochaetales bacterium]|nr:hypothetical protein [Spirochaetales bacterium]
MKRKILAIGVLTLLLATSCDPFSLFQTTNTKPIADAGFDETIDLSETVHLNGTASSDADRDSLTYLWSIILAPEGSSAALNYDRTATPEIIPDITGIYRIQLVVNDGSDNSTADIVTITVNETTQPPNTRPVAVAGNDQTLNLGDSYELNGNGSSDTDNDTLTFSWSITSAPSGATAVLSDPSIFNPTLEPDLAGDYIIQLIVNDGEINSDPDSITITAVVLNTPPVADAGNNRTSTVGTSIEFDGSGSSDFDEDTLSYLWSISWAPAGSTATLSANNVVSPIFIPDLEGDYGIELMVNDGSTDSDSVSFTLTANFSGATKTATILSGITKTGSGTTEDPYEYPNHYGISHYNNELYLTNWLGNNVTKISLSDNAVATGFPKPLVTANLPHGLVVNPEGGSIWMCDLNENMLKLYNSAIEYQSSLSIGVGTEPLNAIIYDGLMYIAVRNENRIYTVDLSDTANQNSFQITDLAPTHASNYIDMSIYNDKLYLIVHDIDGFVRMDLDGTNQERVSIRGETTEGMGIAVLNDKVYINNVRSIFISDLNGNLLNKWSITPPSGYENGEYIDIEVINDKIYLASSWGIYTDGAAHILVYEEY